MRPTLSRAFALALPRSVATRAPALPHAPGGPPPSHARALTPALPRALALPLILALGVASPALAQRPDRLGDPADYRLDRDYEVALARSAAPPEIGRAARVLVFTGAGYEEAASGTNGFTCLVERSWSTPFTSGSDFYNPALRVPICYNEAASRAGMQEYLVRTELALAGATVDDVRAGVAERVVAGTLRPPEGLAVAYMLSAGQVLGTETGRFMPHMMLYVPYATREQFGGSLDNRRLMVFEYEGGPFAALVIPMDAWVEAPALAGG